MNCGLWSGNCEPERLLAHVSIIRKHGRGPKCKHCLNERLKSQWLKGNPERHRRFGREKNHPFTSSGTGMLVGSQRASRQKVDTTPDVSHEGNVRQRVCHKRDGEMTQATSRRKLLVCPHILQRQRQEVIPYPQGNCKTVKISRKLVATGSGNAQLEGPSLQRREGEGRKWVCNQICP